jgi:hypothetical protein
MLPLYRRGYHAQTRSLVRCSGNDHGEDPPGDAFTYLRRWCWVAACQNATRQRNPDCAKVYHRAAGVHLVARPRLHPMLLSTALQYTGRTHWRARLGSESCFTAPYSARSVRPPAVGVSRK